MRATFEVVLPTVWAVGSEECDDDGNGLRWWQGGGFLDGVLAGAIGPGVDDDPLVVGDITYYRRYTEGLLRRYLRLSMEAGRVPSLIGRPMFRSGGVTRYRVRSFDDAVIFVYDVERCLGRLTDRQQKLIERIALQEHTQGHVAEMLGMSLRSVNRRYVEAVDDLSRVFLQMGVLEPMLDCQAGHA